MGSARRSLDVSLAVELILTTADSLAPTRALAA